MLPRMTPDQPQVPPCILVTGTTVSVGQQLSPDGVMQTVLAISNPVATAQVVLDPDSLGQLVARLQQNTSSLVIAKELPNGN